MCVSLVEIMLVGFRNELRQTQTNLTKTKTERVVTLRFSPPIHLNRIKAFICILVNENFCFLSFLTFADGPVSSMCPPRTDQTKVDTTRTDDTEIEVKPPETCLTYQLQVSIFLNYGQFRVAIMSVPWIC